jgi:AcrR family transcriptional regulator
MPKVYPGYRKEAKSRVIKAAVSLFSKKGYHDTTMDDIAGELGVSRGAIYLYFESKEAILQEIFLLNQECLRKMLEQYGEGPDPLKTAEMVFDKITESKKARMPIHFEIVSRASNDETIKRILLEDNGRDVKVVQAFVQHHMDRGNIRNDVDPRILAELIISLAMRSMEKMIIGVNESEVRRTWSESLALILGIKKELIPQASGTEGPSQDRLRST